MLEDFVGFRNKFVCTKEIVDNIDKLPVGSYYSSDKVSELRFGDITLLEIKNKKIVKAIDSIEKINKELKNS